MTAQEQRAAALARANAVRSGSAQLRAQVGLLPYRQGRRRMAALVRQAPPELAATRVWLLLRSVRGVDRVRASAVLRAADLTGCGHLHLRDLSAPQRASLAAALDEAK